MRLCWVPQSHLSRRGVWERVTRPPSHPSHLQKEPHEINMVALWTRRPLGCGQIGASGDRVRLSFSLHGNKQIQPHCSLE